MASYFTHYQNDQFIHDCKHLYPSLSSMISRRDSQGYNILAPISNNFIPRSFLLEILLNTVPDLRTFSLCSLTRSTIWGLSSCWSSLKFTNHQREVKYLAAGIGVGKISAELSDLYHDQVQLIISFIACNSNRKLNYRMSLTQQVLLENQIVPYQAFSSVVS